MFQTLSIFIFKNWHKKLKLQNQREFFSILYSRRNSVQKMSKIARDFFQFYNTQNLRAKNKYKKSPKNVKKTKKCEHFVQQIRNQLIPDYAQFSMRFLRFLDFFGDFWYIFNIIFLRADSGDYKIERKPRFLQNIWISVHFCMEILIHFLKLI